MAVGESFEAVLAAAKVGAAWAFGVLYDEFNPPLLRYFTSRAGSEGEDLTSEVWLAVAKTLSSFAGDERRFRAWIFTIAHHRLADHWDRRRRMPTADLDTDAAGAETVAGPEDGVVAAVSAQVAARRIAAILSRDQAEVVLLRLLGGLDVDEVAAIVGKRPATVRVLQHRGIRKLAAELSLQDVTG